MSYLKPLASGLRKSCLLKIETNINVLSLRTKMNLIDLPKIMDGGAKSGKYRRIVHFPEKYTVKPLDVTNLAGRDPATGRVVVNGIGGGIKRKYHWIHWKREGPTEGPPLVEKVIHIMTDWCRTSRIALVANGNQLKYYLATENMKPGDLIKTSQEIPRIPVLAKEGDAYPLGALPNGTIVNNVERLPQTGGWYVHSAGSSATITRKVGTRVIVKLPSKQEVSLDQYCMATVGRLSNVEHSKTPIGSAQRNRELGNRPRSGLWKRKEGRHGRKIRALPALKVIKPLEIDDREVINLTLNCDEYYNSVLFSHSAHLEPYYSKS